MNKTLKKPHTSMTAITNHFVKIDDNNNSGSIYNDDENIKRCAEENDNDSSHTNENVQALDHDTEASIGNKQNSAPVIILSGKRIHHKHNNVPNQATSDLPTTTRANTNLRNFSKTIVLYEKWV